MSAFYRDARLKVQRAEKHIKEFKAAHAALENSCTSTIQYYPHGGQSLIHEIPDLRDALDELALIAGDAIHNLRSSLDFAWHSTILRLLPDKISHSTKFPVRDTRQDVHGALHGIEVDTRCVRLYECIMSEVQPYDGGDDSSIWALHNFDISDKHLLLLGLDPVGQIHGISVTENGELLAGRSQPANRRDGKFIVDFPSGFKIENKGELSVTITLQETGIFEYTPVESFLSDLDNLALYTIQLLENI